MLQLGATIAMDSNLPVQWVQIEDKTLRITQHKAQGEQLWAERQRCKLINVCTSFLFLNIALSIIGGNASTQQWWEEGQPTVQRR